MQRPAVFLDRDGVLTVPEFRDGRSYAPTSIKGFRLYDDAAGSVARLRQQGFIVIVATNQPDITTGKLSMHVLEEMHRRLAEETGVDDIEVSFGTRQLPDRRRKPATGMLLDAAKKFDLDLAGSYMIGDRASDIECGLAAGCQSVFIDRGYTSEPKPTGHSAQVNSLAEATTWVIQQKQG